MLGILLVEEIFWSKWQVVAVTSAHALTLIIDLSEMWKRALTNENGSSAKNKKKQRMEGQLSQCALVYAVQLLIIILIWLLYPWPAGKTVHLHDKMDETHYVFN